MWLRFPEGVTSISFGGAEIPASHTDPEGFCYADLNTHLAEKIRDTVPGSVMGVGPEDYKAAQAAADDVKAGEALSHHGTDPGNTSEPGLAGEHPNPELQPQAGSNVHEPAREGGGPAVEGEHV